jgi:hypothetical protein
MAANNTIRKRRFFICLGGNVQISNNSFYAHTRRLSRRVSAGNSVNDMGEGAPPVAAIACPRLRDRKLSLRVWSTVDQRLIWLVF